MVFVVTSQQALTPVFRSVIVPRVFVHVQLVVQKHLHKMDLTVVVLSQQLHVQRVSGNVETNVQMELNKLHSTTSGVTVKQGGSMSHK
jgi:hypothetical protein